MVRKPYSPVGFLERFVALEVRAAGLIFGAAVLGVLLATFGEFSLHNNFTELISELAIGGFFLLVGLELRREFARGTLSRATLKIAVVVTIAGMAVPAVIFILFAPQDAREGWVAVVATDIAIASAVMALGGFKKYLRSLLLTVAVLDDLGSVLVLATIGTGPKLELIVLAIAIVTGFAWAIRKFNLGVLFTLCTTGVVVWLMLRAEIHPSLGAFAVGLVVPHFDPDNPSVAEKVEETIHPYVAAILLPIYVFLHTMIPIQIPDGTLAKLIVVTIASKVVGKILGIGGALAVFSKGLKISISEAFAVGCAAAVALTVALVGIEASLGGSIYEQPVVLGIFVATVIAVVLGIVSGRLATDASAESK